MNYRRSRDSIMSWDCRKVKLCCFVQGFLFYSFKVILWTHLLKSVCLVVLNIEWELVHWMRFYSRSVPAKISRHFNFFLALLTSSFLCLDDWFKDVIESESDSVAWVANGNKQLCWRGAILLWNLHDAYALLHQICSCVSSCLHHVKIYLCVGNLK